jgi:hypothetical protein
VHITIKVMISNPAQTMCTRYNIVSDLRQVCGFLRVLQFIPIWWNIVESGVKHQHPNPNSVFRHPKPLNCKSLILQQER